MKYFIVAVKAHVAAAMIHYHKIPKAPQPIRKNYPSRRDGFYFRSICRSNKQTFPGDTTISTWTTKAVGKFPADRQAQAPLQILERTPVRRCIRQPVIIQATGAVLAFSLVSALAWRAFWQSAPPVSRGVVHPA